MMNNLPMRLRGGKRHRGRQRRHSDRSGGLRPLERGVTAAVAVDVGVGGGALQVVARAAEMLQLVEMVPPLRLGRFLGGIDRIDGFNYKTNFRG